MKTTPLLLLKNLQCNYNANGGGGGGLVVAAVDVMKGGCRRHRCAALRPKATLVHTHKNICQQTQSPQTEPPCTDVKDKRRTEKTRHNMGEMKKDLMHGPHFPSAQALVTLDTDRIQACSPALKVWAPSTLHPENPRPYETGNFKSNPNRYGFLYAIPPREVPILLNM